MTSLPQKSKLRSELPYAIILVLGICAGLVVAAVLFTVFMPGSEVLGSMVQQLSFYSFTSIGVGYLLYRLIGDRSPSLNFTFLFTFVWAALLTIVNVWAMSKAMFALPAELSIELFIFLAFAGIIATAFGISVTSRATRTLRQLIHASDQVAQGNLGIRTAVQGRDEVAKVAASFNEMTARLESADKMRQETEQMRRDLIAWTSHDLRTPLTSIRAMIEALNDDVIQDDATKKRYYQTMLNDIVDLNGLIDDLFELAQLEAGGMKMAIIEASLSDIISDVVQSFQAVADKKPIRLVGSISADLDPVNIDPARMTRVLNNLIGNGMKYAREEVSVTANRQEDGVKVCVSDDGNGFNPADLEVVFEKFYRGEEARSRQDGKGGAGLGLAIARSIVEAHGGKIWAENSVTGGAKVHFFLPSNR